MGRCSNFLYMIYTPSIFLNCFIKNCVMKNIKIKNSIKISTKEIFNLLVGIQSTPGLQGFPKCSLKKVFNIRLLK